MKKLLLSAFVAFAMLASTKTFAQQGFGTNEPNKSAAVDIVSSKRGLLIPRLDLSNITVASPVDAPAHGLLVYNKATSSLTGADVANNVTPGFYYWERNNTTSETAWQGKWVRIVSSNTEKKVVVEEGNNVNVVEDVTGLTTTYTVSVDGGTKNGQVLVSVPNPDPATVATEPFVSEWVDPDDFIKGINGINVTTDASGNTNVGLGGSLSKPTTITTTAANTLAIDGLEVLTNATFDPAAQNIVVMGSDGILKEVSPKVLMEDAIAADNLTAKALSSAGGIITVNGSSSVANSVLKDIELGIANKSIGAEKLNPGAATPGQIATVIETTPGDATTKVVQYQDPSTAIGQPLTTDNIIGVGADATAASATTANLLNGAVLTPTYLKIKDDAITAAQIAENAVGASELADNSVASANIIDGSIANADLGEKSVSANKLTSTVTNASGVVTSTAPANTVPTADGLGGVTYQTIAAAAGEDLTTDGKIVIGSTNATTLADAVLAPTRLSIAAESITSADIKNGTITTADIKAPNSSTDNNLDGDENMVMVTDSNGDVTWIAQSSLANKDNYNFTTPLAKDAGTANANGGTDYTVSIATASATTLGVVKQSAATGEEITIATDGSLSINEANVTVGTVAGSDVTGKLNDLTVTGIQSTAVSATAPTAANNMLVYNSTTNQWEPSTVAQAAGKTLTGDGITVTAGTTAGTDVSLAASVLADVTLGIANDAITSEKIKDGEVKTDDLANTSVTAGKLVADLNGSDVNKIPVANANGSVEYKDAATALGKELTSTSITVSTPANQALLQDLNIEIKPGTAANQILTTTGTPGNLTTGWATPNSLVEVNNALEKEAVTGVIQLGGDLIKATAINTAVGGAGNTLAITGLENVAPKDATKKNKVIVAETTDGILRTVDKVIVVANVDIATDTNYSFYAPEVVISVTLANNDQTIIFPSASEAEGQVINIKIANKTETHTGYLYLGSDVITPTPSPLFLAYGSMPYQSWIVKSNGTTWEIVGRN